MLKANLLENQKKMYKIISGILLACIIKFNVLLFLHSKILNILSNCKCE